MMERISTYCKVWIWEVVCVETDFKSSGGQAEWRRSNEFTITGKSALWIGKFRELPRILTRKGVSLKSECKVYAT